MTDNETFQNLRKTPIRIHKSETEQSHDLEQTDLRLNELLLKAHDTLESLRKEDSEYIEQDFRNLQSSEGTQQFQ